MPTSNEGERGVTMMLVRQIARGPGNLRPRKMVPRVPLCGMFLLLMVIIVSCIVTFAWLYLFSIVWRVLFNTWYTF